MALLLDRLLACMQMPASTLQEGTHVFVRCLFNLVQYNYLLSINAPEHFLSIKEHFLFGRKITLINDCSISPS